MVFLNNCLMEGVDRVDYSSDQLEGSDIWGMLGGRDLEQIAAIPLLGTEDFPQAGIGVDLKGVFSPSDFLSFSPPDGLLGDPQTELFGNPPVDLPRSSS